MGEFTPGQPRHSFHPGESSCQERFTIGAGIEPAARRHVVADVG